MKEETGKRRKNTNILDYLDWRGDLPFASSKISEVDALIFAWLVYYRFEELGGETDGKGTSEKDVFDGMTLRELSALHEQVRGPFQKVNLAATIDPGVTSAWLLYRAGQTERFAQVRVCDFRQVADAERGIQFAAVSFVFEDGERGLRVTAFRGTDDSIAGWKEDCYLAISDKVPAQELALKYLEDTADGRRVLVCGHSKGGNLAVYAALFAQQKRLEDLLAVYNFDGPGFCFDIRRTEHYGQIRERLFTIVPESSVVGMILDHEDDYRIVESQMAGLLQHDAMFWQVLGNHFVYADKRKESSLIADRTISSWISGMSVAERKEFVDALFGIIESTGAVRTTELPEKLVQNGFRSLGRSQAGRRQKKLVFHVLLNLIRAGNASLYESVLHSDAAKEFMGYGAHPAGE